MKNSETVPHQRLQLLLRAESMDASLEEWCRSGREIETICHRCEFGFVFVYLGARSYGAVSSGSGDRTGARGND